MTAAAATSSTVEPIRARRLEAFIINLDRATDRWRFVEQGILATGIPYRRVSAVEGRGISFPIPEFDEHGYQRRHGRRRNDAEVGCYLSHLECLRLLLASDLDLAIVLEDDASPSPDLSLVIEEALRYEDAWDVLRLSGYHDPHPMPIATLRTAPPRRLGVPITRLSGAAAYVVGRRAAEVLLRRLVPMRVPFDHALDREWFHGLRVAMVDPLPVAQMGHDLGTQIPLAADRLPWLRRHATVFPYRAMNEASRMIFRIGQWFRGRRIARRIDHRSSPRA